MRTIKIEHIAIWTDDLETLKNFYVKYFNATSNELYTNTGKQFQSYFLSFSSGARLELMKRPDIKAIDRSHEYHGFCHFAASVGSKDNVLELTERLRSDGYQVVGEPRHTGDGYFESVILDPDGNRIEITM